MNECIAQGLPKINCTFKYNYSHRKLNLSLVTISSTPTLETFTIIPYLLPDLSGVALAPLLSHVPLSSHSNCKLDHDITLLRCFRDLHLAQTKTQTLHLDKNLFPITYFLLILLACLQRLVQIYQACSL